MKHISEFLPKANSLEFKARMSKTCPVCGEAKKAGVHSQIVCWGECWRGNERTGFTGLKYTELDTEQWLKDNIKYHE